MPALALLHTSPAHVPVFDALRDRHHPGLELRHVVAPELLDGAREHGPAAMAGEVARLVREAAEGGAAAVLCTCSSIGAVAEAVPLAVPVLRLDRPMAAEAVRLGGRVVVLGTVASTLEPTLALLAEEAAALGDRGAAAPADSRATVLRDGRAAVPADAPTAAVSLEGRLVEGAWERWEAGDTAGYLAAVAAAADALTASGAADVIVLAQASMAPAVALVRPGTPVPVLSSPAPGLAAAAAAAAGVRSAGAGTA
ncbi:aspartate/glutamate racemase family protein [Streptomyces sp. NPDC101132]|uniref:aspartate/glutamate racemase family protein n=1 Tax=Streptomyces sp. NPDC101132 TaxID=3366110 RepID=UPI003821DA23